MGPTLILLPPLPPQACQAGILLQGQTLGKWQRFWKAVSALSQRAGTEDGDVKALGGEPGAEKGTGAWSPHGRVHQGPGSALSWHLLARPWLRYLTPGARSHMPGNRTLWGPSPQFPAATSKQGFWRRKRVSSWETDYFRGEDTKKALPPTGVRG